MRPQHLSALLALATLLATAALASGRIALVRLTRGVATVDGKAMSVPLLVSENAVLVLSENSRVRIQLLGSNRELTVEGPNSVVLRGAQLKKQASAIKRLPVAVAANDPTNHNRTAGIIIPSPPPAPPPPPPSAAPSGASPATPSASAALRTPPWEGPVVAAQPVELDPSSYGFLASKVSPRPSRVAWQLSDLQEGRLIASGAVEASEFERAVQEDKPLFTLPRTRIETNGRYKLTLLSESPGFAPHTSVESFRILGAEENTVLEASVAMAEQMDDGDEKPASLVDAGLLAYDWDQWRLAQRLLQRSETVAPWALLDNDTRDRTVRTWYHLRRVLGEPAQLP